MDAVTRPLDTSRDAAARQVDALRAMSPEERLRIAAAMSDDVRSLAEAGIRSRLPGLSDDEVRAALEALLLGRDLADSVRSDRPPTER